MIDHVKHDHEPSEDPGLTIRPCSDVPSAVTFAAFRAGFADYPVKFNFSEQQFVERFFGMEGNRPADSFLAFDGAEPVGLILGGIRTHDGERTLRCGTLCVVPARRGNGVSQALYRRFEQNGCAQNCTRALLEVLSENGRAIRFYEKQGFQKRNRLLYFRATGQAADANALDEKHEKYPDIVLGRTELEQAAAVRETMPACRLNWQNEPAYFRLDKQAACFAAYDGGGPIGLAVMTPAGKIYFLWVAETHRRRGVARRLLRFAKAELQAADLSIGLPDTVPMLPFLSACRFVREKTEQFEMVKHLSLPTPDV